MGLFNDFRDVGGIGKGMKNLFKEGSFKPSSRHQAGGSYYNQTQPGAMQGQPRFMQGQPGAMQGQPRFMQGQPGAMQGQSGFMQGQSGVPPSNFAGGFANMPEQKYDLWKGSTANIYQQPTMTPEQTGAQGQALQMALSGLKNPTGGFDAMENQARETFQTQTMPRLAEQLGALGPGATLGSGFPGVLEQSSRKFDESLQSMRSEYGQQNVGQMINLLRSGLGPSFENLIEPGKPGAAQGISSGIGTLLSNVLPKLPKAIGSIF